MLEVVIASGKGGVGKSTLSSTLALYLSTKGYNIVAVDADADAPNLHLIFGVDKWEVEEDYREAKIAVIDYSKCINCGICAKECPYNAIKLVDNKYIVNTVVCEGCLTCSLVCPTKAISRVEVVSGKIRITKTRYGFPLISARLSVGRPNSGKLVTEIKNRAKSIASDNSIIIVDSAAGIGCQVISSLAGANAAILVAEPTPASLSDLKRVTALTRQFLIPAGIVINKFDVNPEYVDKIIEYAENEGLDILGLIPYDDNVPRSMAYRKPLVEIYPNSKASKALMEVASRIEEKVIRNWKTWYEEYRPKKPKPYKPLILKPSTTKEGVSYG